MKEMKCEISVNRYCMSFMISMLGIEQELGHIQHTVIINYISGKDVPEQESLYFRFLFCIFRQNTHSVVACHKERTCNQNGEI